MKYEVRRKKEIKKSLELQASDFRLQSGFTLIDVLVGTALLLIVFLGIFGAYQLGLKVIGQSKNKIVATSIANGEIEKIRNLPYQDIGTIGASPSPPYAIGILEAATSTTLNSVQYDVTITVKYIVDDGDGLAAPDDQCPNDYKRCQVEVSWVGRFGGKVVLVTDVAPKNLAQECATGGGILAATIFNAYGATTSSPLIEVRDPQTNNLIDSYTPVDGRHYFPLATSTYKVVVSKGAEYTEDRTYGTEEVATPEKPHPLVLKNQISELSFSIDKVSAFTIDTLSPWGIESFSDSFLGESKISEKSNLVISEGKVDLATTAEGYYSSGYLISIDISPTNLIKWDKFSFGDSEPENTDLKYQIYYASGTEWLAIPDSDLPENSAGFDISPVDLSTLSTTTYSQLKLRGNFFSDSTSTTPTLYDWQTSWINITPTPIPNATFNLRGAKIIGTDINENPVYKYSTTTSSNSVGHKGLLNLEWDSYTYSVNPSSGLDLIDTQPSPQPISLSPNTNLPVNLYLEAQNSLLVTVQNFETLEPVFSASVRLFNAGIGYDITQYTNEKGQTYFIPLEVATYNLEIQAAGYLATSTAVSVSGDVTKIIKIEQVE